MAAARVSQSVFEVVALANPYARVSQSALELLVIPGPVSVIGVQIVFRGVKRLADNGGSGALQEVQGASHVERAV